MEQTDGHESGESMKIIIVLLLGAIGIAVGIMLAEIVDSLIR